MMQGLAGWQSLTGDPGGPPMKSGLSLVDLSGGYASAIALLRACGVPAETASGVTATSRCSRRPSTS